MSLEDVKVGLFEGTVICLEDQEEFLKNQQFEATV
jgi:hypothetical protein